MAASSLCEWLRGLAHSAAPLGWRLCQRSLHILLQLVHAGPQGGKPFLASSPHLHRQNSRHLSSCRVDFIRVKAFTQKQK